MGLSLSWETNAYLATEETPIILRNLKVPYRVHKSLYPEPDKQSTSYPAPKPISLVTYYNGIAEQRVNILLHRHLQQLFTLKPYNLKMEAEQMTQYDILQTVRY
jgi:hypothetical protein